MSGKAKLNLTSCLKNVTSETSSDSLNALIEIRKVLIKTKEGISQFIRDGGLESLLTVLPTWGSKDRRLDVASSILGNICMEEECRKKISTLDGITTIVDVLMRSDVTCENIQNRICRTIGNLAMNADCRKAIHEEEGVLTKIITILDQTKDTSLQITLLRTMRLLGGKSEEKRAIVKADGLRVSSKFLKCDKDTGLIKAALATVSHFTSKLTSDHVRQLMATNASGAILDLVTKCKEESIAKQAWQLALQWTNQSELRTGLGNAGILDLFLDVIQRSNDECDLMKKLSCVRALCKCTREVTNRTKLRESNGLRVIIELLKSDRYKGVHFDLTRALVNYLYDDDALGIFLNHDIIGILVARLREFCEIKEIRIDGYEPPQCSPSVVQEETSKAPCQSPVNPEMDTSMNSRQQSTDIATDTSEIPQVPSTSRTCSEDTNNQHRYSVDSPTYKMISEFKLQETSESGPMNLGEAHYLGYAVNQSPMSAYAPCSPLSIGSSYVSPSWSPASSPGYSSDSYRGSPIRDQMRWSPISFESQGDWSFMSTQASVESSPVVTTPSTPKSQSPMTRSSSTPAMHYSFSEQNEGSDDPGCSADLNKQNKSQPDGGPVTVTPQPEPTTNSRPLPHFDILNMMPEPTELDKYKAFGFAPPDHKKEHYILILLARFSHPEIPNKRMLQMDVWRTLVGYYYQSTKPIARAHRILQRLANNRHCFERIITNQIPVMLHWYTHRISSCHASENIAGDILKSLTFVAESEYGTGTLANLLLTGPKRLRINTAICLPYVLRTKSILAKHTFDHRGLRLLLEEVTSDQDSKTLMCARRALEFLLEKPARKVMRPARLLELSRFAKTSNTVTLVFDDGRTIEACRETLAKVSDVFKAMFQGAFTESSKETIDMINTNFDAVDLLISYLHDGVDKEVPDIDIVVDALFLADKYNIVHFHIYLIGLLESRDMKPRELAALLPAAFSISSDGQSLQHRFFQSLLTCTSAEVLPIWRECVDNMGIDSIEASVTSLLKKTLNQRWLF